MAPNPEHNSRGPIFVLGFPRSGTTAVARALASIEGAYGSQHEGHYLYFLLEGLRDILDGQKLNPASLIVRNDGAIDTFVEEFGLFIDRFRSKLEPNMGSRWVDKTPDIRQVRVAPVLARVFPTAQFVFMYRHPVSTLQSNVQNWPNVRDALPKVAERWVSLMREWRRLRDRIGEVRFIEVSQEHMKADCETVIGLLADFVGAKADDVGRMREVLSNKTINTRQNNGDQEKTVLLPSEISIIEEITASEVKHWPKLTASRCLSWKAQ